MAIQGVISERKPTRGEWYISVSIFEDGNPGAWEIASHEYTVSTRDGGLSGLIHEIVGRELEV